MKLVALLLPGLVGAFLQQAPIHKGQQQMTTLKAGADEMVGVDVEHKLFLGKEDESIYDPLGFAKIHDLIKDDPEHFGVWPSPQWLREAELKHGRVSMLAFVGAIIQGAFGFSWSGSLGGYYYETDKNFFTEALGSSIKTNSFAMAQILLSIWLVESKFYPDGAWLGSMERAPGDLGLNVANTKDDPIQQLKELKNGTLSLSSS